MNAALEIVESLLGDNEDPKDFIARNFTPRPTPDTKHFFNSVDGGLYDTRKRDWHTGPPLRANYQRFHRTIDTPEQFKATWRARYQSNYRIAFMTDDGAVLCEECTKENLRRILSSIRSRARDGWRVVGAALCHGDPDEPNEEDEQCAHCNKNLGEIS